jgi:hypothetical protein
MASTIDARTENVVALVLRWPAERERLVAARRDGIPRLVLVEHATSPPVGSDPLEDWVRLPATHEDIRWRVEVLEQRAIGRAETGPILDADGLLRHQERITVLTPIEQRLVTLLVDRYRMVVTRSELFYAGWPDEEPNANALDVALVRVRRQLSRVGLRLTTVRGRGYLLDADRR